VPDTREQEQHARPEGCSAPPIDIATREGCKYLDGKVGHHHEDEPEDGSDYVSISHTASPWIHVPLSPVKAIGAGFSHGCGLGPATEIFSPWHDTRHHTRLYRTEHAEGMTRACVRRGLDTRRRMG